MQAADGWDPGTRGHELPTLWITKGHKDGGTAEVDGETQQEQTTQGEEQDLPGQTVRV